MSFGPWTESKFKKKFGMSLKQVGTFIQYSRGAVRINFIGDLKKMETKINVVPRSPVNLPERITSHYMIEFPKTLVLPNEQQTIFVKIPLEVEVRLGKKAIDFIGFTKPTFMLYGPVDGGIIARRIIGSVILEKDFKKAFDGKHMIIPLRLKNYTSKIKEVTKILVDTRYLDLYYERGGVQAFTEKLKMDLTIRGVFVRYLNASYVKGLQKLSGKSQTLKREEKVKMEWEA